MQDLEVVVRQTAGKIDCNLDEIKEAVAVQMTAYKELGWNIKDFPNSYDYYVNLITLPLHTKLTDDDVDYVISNYKEVVSKYI